MVVPVFGGRRARFEIKTDSSVSPSLPIFNAWDLGGAGTSPAVLPAQHEGSGRAKRYLPSSLGMSTLLCVLELNF